MEANNLWVWGSRVGGLDVDIDLTSLTIPSRQKRTPSYSHLPARENGGATPLNAITKPWEMVGALAPRPKTEDAGSRGRQVRSRSPLTRITKTTPQKGSPARYLYPTPGTFIVMMADQL